jgi:hypothetical protein
MLPHQYLVGGVALGLGILTLAGAITNHASMFRLAKARMLEDLLGRRGARFVCGLLGCGLIVVGGLILAGVLPRKTSRTLPQQDVADHAQPC